MTTIDCTECGETFNGKKNQIRCPSCIDGNKDTCIQCNKKYVPKKKIEPTDLKRFQKCYPCWSKFSVICSGCNMSYIEDNYNRDKGVFRCPTCEHIHSSLMNGTIGKSKIITGSKLRITWEITTITHGGYCSDHESEDEEINTETNDYPLLKEFDGLTDVYSGPILLYQKINTPHSSYCNGGTSYQMTNAEIIKG